MLTRFTEDLQKIAVQGGLSATNEALQKALIAFAMQMYAKNAQAATDDKKKLFNTNGITEGGGLHFKFSDVAPTLTQAKGYSLYFDAYLNTWNPEEKAAALSELPGTEDWYVQAGGPALKATAGTDRAFMIGGDQGDELTGGLANDVLYGGKSCDRLTDEGMKSFLLA